MSEAIESYNMLFLFSRSLVAAVSGGVPKKASEPTNPPAKCYMTRVQPGETEAPVVKVTGTRKDKISL